MSKEALKLTLEALEGLEALLLRMGLTHLIIYGDAEKAITALQEAMAEQPAQQQEQYIGETNVELGFYSDDASNGQQRELVGKVEMGQLVGNRPHESTSNPDTEREIAVITGVDEYGPILGWFKHWINYPVGTKLYTSPPAQQQEPVKACATGQCPCKFECDSAQCCLYTSPPASKPWVELTADEMVGLVKKYRDAPVALVAATEAKLKEKNA